MKWEKLPAQMQREEVKEFYDILQKKRGSLVAKRIFDLIFSVLLLVLLSPFMLIIAIAVKCTSPGEIIFRQTRVTTYGKRFQIYKFRTMVSDAPQKGSQVTVKGDSRVTGVGHFLRKVRLDELPQLLNILKGEMSIVGPRPERPEIAREYMKDVPEFGLRLKVKAGLTGYAQVYGKYNTTPYDKLKLDLFYIENYSLWLDIQLMFMTFRILFQKESSEGVESWQKNALYQSDDHQKKEVQ